MIASNDYLHEKELKRGEFCTSVDAFVYALDERSERWLIPIEWKYTETKHSIYFQEPFYQLMRQTLWAECICRNKVEKVLPAEHFVHIHVCPKDNRELLNKCYSEVTDKSSIEEAWREVLTDQSLYHLVDPKELLQPIAQKYPELYNYLQGRYWQ